MFGTNHYVPILRWKQAERLALHRLRSDDKARMTPVIEITPKSFFPKKRVEAAEHKPTTESMLLTELAPDPGSVLRRHAKEILRVWGNSPFFLELAHLEGAVPAINGSVHPLTYLSDLGRDYRLKVVPVTGLDRPVRYRTAVAIAVRTDRNGLCLRVSPAELLEENLPRRLEQFLDGLGMSAAELDLLVDYGVFDPDAPRIRELLPRVPQVRKLRSLILARGAFPKDLQDFDPGTHRIVRSDWTGWKSELRDRGRLRWPSFSDYTIQYGRYVEPVDNANPSASIRYTLDEEWLIMRGEGIFNEDGPGRAQWNANAILLMERDEFYGEAFSDGDTYIAEMSRKQKDHGSPMTWIRAGLNHHMSLVSRQIGAL